MNYYAWDRVTIRATAPRAAGLNGTVTATVPGEAVHVKPDGWSRTVKLSASDLRPLHPESE